MQMWLQVTTQYRKRGFILRIWGFLKKQRAGIELDLRKGLEAVIRNPSVSLLTSLSASLSHLLSSAHSAAALSFVEFTL